MAGSSGGERLPLAARSKEAPACPRCSRIPSPSPVVEELYFRGHLLPRITVWRKPSLALSIAVHISVNCIFLLLMPSAFTAD